MLDSAPGTHSNAIPFAATAPLTWFAVQTKPRHEKKVAAELSGKGVEVFLPLVSSLHQWSDRKRQVELPLFSSYTFVRIPEERAARVSVLRTNGIFGFVGVRGIGVAIPDEQIEAVRVVLRERVPFTACPFIDVGQKVRIRGGSLDGIQGIVAAINGNRSLVIAVDGVQRALAIRLDGYGVEPVAA